MRVQGWEEKLIVTVDAWRRKRFKWGRADCASFAVACIKAVRGRTAPRVEIPGYADVRQARRALQKMNCVDLTAAFAAHLETIPVAMAGRGDVGITISDGAQCAVVNTGLWWAGKTERGLIRVPRETITAAFRV